MSESGGDPSIHVDAHVDPEVTWVDNPSPNSKGKYGHPGYWPVGIYVEGGGGNYRQQPEVKCPPP